MLHDMDTLTLNYVWSDAEINEKPSHIQLVPRQQSTMDTSICWDQYSLDHSQMAKVKEQSVWMNKPTR